MSVSYHGDVDFLSPVPRSVERDRRYATCKRAGLRRLISEGDSWFDYPPHPNIIDWLDGEGLWAIKRFEKSGDTVDNIAGEANLSRVAATAQRERSEAILFSGGGNDLFTDIPEKPKLRWIHSADFGLDFQIRGQLPVLPLNATTKFQFGTSIRAERLGADVGWLGLELSFLLR